MTEKSKNILYILIVMLLSYLLFREYTYVIPYNYDWFIHNFFSIIPIESTISWTWIFLLIAGLIYSLPLFRKRKIGLLGLFLLIGVISKPFFIKKTPIEDPIAFFDIRKNEMKVFVEKYKNSKKNRIINDELKDLGFEQLLIEGDTYIFTVHSFLDNSYGFCYDKDGKLPKSILSGSSFFEKIDLNWYKFVTT